MTSKGLSTFAAGPVAEARKGATHADRQAAANAAVELIEFPGCERTAPRFFADLPWQDNSDAIVDGMIAQMFMAEDPDAANEEDSALKAAALVGIQITVHDFVARPSSTDRGWGAYLALDITVEDEAEHRYLSLSAKQAVARLARAYVEGAIPCTGTFVQLAAAAKGQSAPLGFVIESGF